MSLVRWTPNFSSLAALADFLSEDESGLTTRVNNNLDVYETEDEIVVKANVAGVPADKVEVVFEKGVLWIKAEKEEEVEDKEKQHYTKSAWSYAYRVVLPNTSMIDQNYEPEAEVDNGVVTIRFKKTETSKPKKLKVREKKSKK
jgi:HSP20 family protein